MKGNFPAKIYQILENESDEIISWDANGLSFKILDQKRFENEVLPKYFRRNILIYINHYINHQLPFYLILNYIYIYIFIIDNQISSVQRQLNLYGFKSINRGDLKRAFFHPNFIKGDLDKVKTISRIYTREPKKAESLASDNSILLKPQNDKNESSIKYYSNHKNILSTESKEDNFESFNHNEYKFLFTKYLNHFPFNPINLESPIVSNKSFMDSSYLMNGKVKINSNIHDMEVESFNIHKVNFQSEIPVFPKNETEFISEIIDICNKL